MNPLDEAIDYLITEIVRSTASWHKQGLEHFEWDVVAAPYRERATPVRVGMHLHYANYQIWHYEDYCRSGIEAEIIRCKPQIDKFNQQRNDLIEKVDEYMIAEQQGTGAYNTETFGSVVDRLSILALKVYHWNELVVAGRNKFQPKLLVAKDQYEFLSRQLKELLDDMQCGKRQMRLFRQLKMYNNAETNPLHKDAGARPAT